MTRRVILLLLCLSASAPSARAEGWEPLSWRARLDGVHSSNLLPGAQVTGPDGGVHADLLLESATRLPGRLKLGLEARGGGQFYRRFDEGRYGWFGGGASLRRGGTQLTVGGEWTPHRIKFSDETDRAVFDRLEVTAGVRQSLPANLRLRLEGTVGRDDYVTTYDRRDGRVRGAEAQLSWSPTAALRLGAETEFERTTATAGKYTHRDRQAGGSVAWTGLPWKLEAGFSSGVRRYPDAEPDDSNYRRRDQWTEGTFGAARRIVPGLDLRLGFGVLDQTSSRVDRNHTVTTWRLGFEWSAAR